MTPEMFREIIEKLESMYPEEYPAHVSGDPFEILVGAILSQRTRDEMTDRAFKALFQRFPTAESIAGAPAREIERLIRPVGFYRVKARRIKEVAKIVVEKYGGAVPRERDELLKLPGVGHKTADIVLSMGYGLPEIAVDTHVETVAKRLGIADEKDGYLDVKKKLETLTPIEKRLKINHLFVEFGKEYCRKPRPRCSVCPIKGYCRYYKLAQSSPHEGE